MVQASRDVGLQVIWDLCHYGWPNDLDVFSPGFVDRFRAVAKAFATLISNETDDIPFFAPINEISFLAWGGGEKGFLNPFSHGRGTDLKCQLIRATIAAIDSIREVAPHARFVQIDPLINVVPGDGASDHEKKEAASYTLAQYEAYDMLSGRLCPQLGGDPRYLDIIGANYYVHNQWVLGEQFIERSDPRYRPLNRLLRDLYTRYRRPLFVAETGIEDGRRAEWLSYVANEVIAAIEQNISVEGICLYPIVNHPGWEDERHCHNGLWDYCNENGDREIYEPLAEELKIQSFRFEQALQGVKTVAGNVLATLLNSNEEKYLAT